MMDTQNKKKELLTKLIDIKISLRKKSKVLYDISNICATYIDHNPSLIKTAACIIQNGKIFMEFNSKFCSFLQDEELLAVMEHECFHLLLLHIMGREKDKQPECWNIATDCVINQMIENIPFNCVTLNSLKELGIAQKKIIPGQSSEYYYDLIKEQYDKRKEEIEKLLKDMKFDEGVIILDGEGNPMEAPGSGSLKDMLDGSIYDSLCDNLKDSSEEIKKALEEMKKKGQQQAKNYDKDLDNAKPDPDSLKKKNVDNPDESLKDKITKNYGNGGANTLYEVVYRKNYKIKDRLNEFLKGQMLGSRNVEKKSSWRRRNRRTPWIFPGTRKRMAQGKAMVYIDSSGSINEYQLKTFVERIDLLNNEIAFDVKAFNDRVYPVKYLPRRPLKIAGGGGTSFHAVIDDFEKVKNEYDYCIVFTDGEAAVPNKPDFAKKVVWVLYPGCTFGYGGNTVWDNPNAINMAFTGEEQTN